MLLAIASRSKKFKLRKLKSIFEDGDDVVVEGIDVNVDVDEVDDDDSKSPLTSSPELFRKFTIGVIEEGDNEEK